LRPYFFRLCSKSGGTEFPVITGFPKGPATIAKQWRSGYPQVAKRLFFEAKYPEQQCRMLKDSMAKVASATPFMMTGESKAELSGRPLGPYDEHAIFTRIDPPEGTNTYMFDRESCNSAMLGGVRNRVEATKRYKG